MELTELRKKLKSGDLACANCNEHTASDVHHLNGNHSDNAPENLAPWCKLCHDEHHGITPQLNDLCLVVRQFYAVQDMRKAMSNRIQAYHRLGYYAEHAGEVYDQTKALEDYIGKVAAQMIKEVPIYQAWLRHVVGIGPALSAAIVSNIRSVDKFVTISALWAYSGLDVRDGQARKRRKGEKANWNADLRMLIAFKVPTQFIKATGSFGRQLYDQYKAFYEATHDQKCPTWSHPDAKVNKAGTKATLNGKGCSRKGHINNMTMRKVGKVFLSCLWLAWRELEGLPVTAPYAEDKLGHTSIIKPHEWTKEDLATYQLRLEVAHE